MSPSLPPTRSEKLAFAKPIVSVASSEKYVRHIPHVPTDIILSVKAISRGLVRLPPLIVTMSPLSYPTLYNESLGMSSTRLPHIFTSSTAALTSIAFSPTGSLSESEHENSIAVSNAKNNIFFISVYYSFGKGNNNIPNCQTIRDLFEQLDVASGNYSRNNEI